MKAIHIKWDIDKEVSVGAMKSPSIALPSQIQIPYGMTNEDVISDYISDITGFCHKGFDLAEIETGKLYIFRTVQIDLVKYNGTHAEVIRPLSDQECDIEEVGNMYKVRFWDGFIKDAFEDELHFKEV